MPYYGRTLRDQAVAAAIDAETRPSDRIYVLDAEPNIYFLADRATAYPYIWAMPMEKIPDAIPRLDAMLDGPDRPTIVVLNVPASDVDPSGRTAHILAERYRLDRIVHGVTILRAD